MERRDKLALLVTFGFGFFSGFYLYLVGFSPNFSINLEDRTAETFSVAGEQYGGCERVGNCPLFRVNGAGEYRYAPATSVGGEQYFLDGKLPQSIFNDLVTELESSDLEGFSKLIDPVSCPSFVDGIDVIYTVDVEKAEYNLDTCGTAFSHSTPLGEVLVDLWQFFESEVSS